MKKTVAMKRKSSHFLAITLWGMLNFQGHAQNTNSARELINHRVSQEQARLFALYKHLHTHPELSFQEEQTSARVAEELRGAGYEVTTGVGRYGVDRKSTRLNSSHGYISYAVFCLKKKKKEHSSRDRDVSGSYRAQRS